MSPAISTVKKRLTSDQTMNRASTCPESVEAESGKSGNVDFISGGSQGPGLSGLPPAQEHDEEDEADHGREAGHAHEPQGDDAVAADHRVVVKAVEQDLVDEAADLVAGGLDQAEPQVARRVLDAEEIARDPPLG